HIQVGVDATVATGDDIQSRIATDRVDTAQTHRQVELVCLRTIEYTVAEYVIGPEITAATAPSLTAEQLASRRIQQLSGETLEHITAGIARGNLIGDAHQTPLQPLFAACTDASVHALHAAQGQAVVGAIQHPVVDNFGPGQA